MAATAIDDRCRRAFCRHHAEAHAKGPCSKCVGGKMAHAYDDPRAAPAPGATAGDPDLIELGFGPGFILKRDVRGRWRAYHREVVTGYYGWKWGQGMNIHERDRALRSANTGNPLPPLADAEAMAAAVKAALDAEDLLPWG